MKFKNTYTLPASIETIWALWTSPAFNLEKYQTLGSTDFQVIQHQTLEQTASLAFSHNIKMDLSKIPAFARGLFKSEVPLQQTHDTTWILATQFMLQLVIKISGIPLMVQATAMVNATNADSVRLDFDTDVSSSLLLVGARLAAFIAEDIKATMQAEHLFTLQYVQQASNSMVLS